MRREFCFFANDTESDQKDVSQEEGRYFSSFVVEIVFKSLICCNLQRRLS